MKQKNFPRHFPYQHPTFGTVKRPKTARSWESSVYYWWWCFLKRNKDYLECCENGGTGPLAEHYKDFGDVRDDDFKAWWSFNNRGAQLFAEPRVENSVRVLSEADQVPSIEESITISFPLNMPKQFLLKRCQQILAKTREGGRGKQYSRNSNAPYRITGQPNIASLKRILTVYDAIEAAKERKPKRPYWRIATDLSLIKDDDKVLPSDSPLVAENKRNVMKAIVSRLKRRAEILIKQSVTREFIGK